MNIENCFRSKTKLVSVVHVSNSLGTVNPVKEIIDEAHKIGALGFYRWCPINGSS